MKKHFIIFLVSYAMISSCKKEEHIHIIADRKQNQLTGYDFPLSEARAWMEIQDSSLHRLTPNWNTAKKQKGTNTWLMNIPGSPTLQDVRQGYRKLAIYRDTTGNIDARILEVIPDVYTLQEFGKMQKGKFSGRILAYSTSGHLESGRLYSSGKVSGEIKPAKTNSLKLQSLQAAAASTNQLSKQAGIVVENCSWIDSHYIDSEGTFTVRSERMCDYEYYDGNGGGGYSGSDYLAPPDDLGGGVANFQAAKTQIPTLLSQKAVTFLEKISKRWTLKR